jgi:hypothetical protein
MKTIPILILLIALSSCAGYRTHWGCCPARGVPCTPVTEIEGMIIESDEGPNIFLGSESDRKPLPGKRSCALSLSPNVHRVWITETTAKGEYCQGFYLYLNEECDK